MDQKKKIAVYTCITGNYDNLKEIELELFEENIDYYCFTNNKEIKSETWKVIYIEDFELSNHMLNRKIKMLGHEIINNNYDVLIWIDGSISLKKKITTFLKEQCDLNNFSFCAFKHPIRNCIYEEGIACARFKKENIDTIKKQLEFYKEDDYPKNKGLCEMGIFVRKMDDEKNNKTMKLWYEMINKFSKRDQLSFMWCASKTKLKLQVIPMTISDNPYFKLNDHIKKIKKLGTYRLYFGNSIDLELNRIEDGKFEIKKNVYTINTKILEDTSRIEFELDSVPFILFDNLNIKTKNKVNNIIYYNFCYIGDSKIFYNSSPVILIEGDFKKNTDIKISIELKQLDNKDLMNILMEQAEKEKIEKQKIEQEYKTKIENIKKENEKLKQENEKWFNNYHQITTSKGWKILEHIRKFKEKLKIK